MINKIKTLFGIGRAIDYKQLRKNNALIIDVRSHSEFLSGNIEGSVNIPLNQLSTIESKIAKDKIIITCCASGIRSASAKSTLKSLGYTQIYNGGGWTSLQNKL